MITTATCQKEEQQEAVDLLYQSGPEIYEYLFTIGNKKAKDYIAFEYAINRGLCAHSKITGIYYNKKLIGTACLSSRKDYDAIVLETLFNVFKFYTLKESLKVLSRFMKLNKVMKSPKRNELYLSNFSISSSHRNKGFGTAFIEVAKNTCRSMGFTLLGLDVEEDNHKAFNLYNRVGFKTVKIFSTQIRHPLLEEIGMKKMIMYV